MKFTLLDFFSSQDFWPTVFVALLISGISWAIFYYTIKAAVTNGMIEAQPHLKKHLDYVPPAAMFDKAASSAQIELQKKYDRGEIPFADYKAQWDKL